MATKAEIEAIKRRQSKLAEEETSASAPEWKRLAAKSNKGLKKSQANSRKHKQDALLRRLPGAGWTKSG